MTNVDAKTLMDYIAKMPSPQEAIRAHMSKLGKSRSRKKLWALSVARAKAKAACARPIEELEAAYQLVKSGEKSRSQAALDAGVRYNRFKAFCVRRDAGQTLDVIRATL